MFTKKSQKPFRKNAPLIANRKCICQNSSFAPTTKVIIFLRKKKIIETLWKLVTDQFVTDIFFTIMFYLQIR